MLTKLIIDNYLSFIEKTEIDFRKTSYTILPSNITENKVLKGAIFVGANASGKTNIINAIAYLLDLFFSNTQEDDTLFYKSCLFSNKHVYSLEYTFLIDTNEVEYYIQVDEEKKLIVEKLKVDKKVLFERMGETAKSFISDENGIIYTDDVAEDASFLRAIYFNTKFAGNVVLKKWMDFLKNSICCDLYRNVCLMRNDDLSIRKYLDREGTERINKFFDKYNFEQKIEYGNTASGNHLSIKSEEKMIFFRRESIDEPIPFPLESLGNRTLLKLLPFFLSVIDNGGMLIIDEFSSGFHNDLEELLVKYFMENSTNSQLFMVSHSTNLLKNSLLRPDQEYSVYFDGKHGSKLKRFSDAQPRNAQNIEKMYNSGVFGGLPNYEVNEDED